jgi:hypothetical protein
MPFTFSLNTILSIVTDHLSRKSPFAISHFSLSIDDWTSLGPQSEPFGLIIAAAI